MIYVRSISLDAVGLSHSQGFYTDSKVLVATSVSLEQKGDISGSDISRNRLYTLSNRQKSKVSMNIVTNMLKLFSCDVEFLLYLGSTLLYEAPYMYSFWF